MPVYMIRSGDTDYVKIGWCAPGQEGKRLRNLQAGSYEILSYVRIIECESSDERRFHQYFRHVRLRREWFSFVPEMLTVSVADLPTEIQTLPMPKATRQLIAASMRKSWREGSLRRTYEGQHGIITT